MKLPTQFNLQTSQIMQVFEGGDLDNIGVQTLHEIDSDLKSQVVYSFCIAVKQLGNSECTIRKDVTFPTSIGTRKKRIDYLLEIDNLKYILVPITKKSKVEEKLTRIQTILSHLQAITQEPIIILLISKDIAERFRNTEISFMTSRFIK